MLLVSLFVIVIVGLSIASSDKASHHIEGLSNVGAICLLVVYGAWIWGYLRSDPEPGEAGEEETTAPALDDLRGRAARDRGCRRGLRL